MVDDTKGQASRQPTPSAEERKLAIEEGRLELDRLKFEHDKQKSANDGFFNKNFGVIVTAIIGIATVTVSFIQLSIATDNNKAQLVLQTRMGELQIQNERLKIEDQESKDRKSFQFDLARMLIERQNEISTNDCRKVIYLRTIVMSVLPSEIGQQIAQNMVANVEDPVLKAAWKDALVDYESSHGASSPAPGAPTAGAAGATGAPLTVDSVIASFSQLAPRRQRLADLIDIADENKLTRQEQVVLLAIVLDTTSFFAIIVETLNYSPNRLHQIWPSIFPTSEKVDNDPRKLANAIYADRLGNTDPDDGWKYRGRGYLQILGRANYMLSGRLIGVDLVADPDLLATDSKIAAREAVARFMQLKDRSSLPSAVRRLNGGIAGLSRMQSIYQTLAPSSPKLTSDLPVSPGAEGQFTKVACRSQE